MTLPRQVLPDATIAELDRICAALSVGVGNEAALHRYWVAGEGLAKWAKSAHPWTALRRHLAKYIKDPVKLDATVSKWHYEVFHEHTGSDSYRLKHGGKIRGNKIGKG